MTRHRVNQSARHSQRDDIDPVVAHAADLAYRAACDSYRKTCEGQRREGYSHCVVDELDDAQARAAAHTAAKRVVGPRSRRTAIATSDAVFRAQACVPPQYPGQLRADGLAGLLFDDVAVPRARKPVFGADTVQRRGKPRQERVGHARTAVLDIPFGGQGIQRSLPTVPYQDVSTMEDADWFPDADAEVPTPMHAWAIRGATTTYLILAIPLEKGVLISLLQPTLRGGFSHVARGSALIPFRAVSYSTALAAIGHHVR